MVTTEFSQESALVRTDGAGHVEVALVGECLWFVVSCISHKHTVHGSENRPPPPTADVMG